MKTIKPTGKNVILAPVEFKQTKGGIFLSQTRSDEERPSFSHALGDVVEVGPDVTDPTCKVGARAVVSRTMIVYPDGPDSRPMIVANYDHIVGFVVDQEPPQA